MNKTTTMPHPAMPHPARVRAAGALVAFAAAFLGGCGKADPAPPAAPEGVAAKATAAIHALAGKPAADADGNASAETVAKAARGDLACPPKIATAARDPAAPVDDIQGVRPGLSFEEASAAVLCTGPLLVATPAQGRGFDLTVAGRRGRPEGVRQGFTARDAEARVVKSSRQIMKELQDGAMARGMNALREDLKPGQAKWFVATMGIPGQERVLSVAREERFAEGQNPTVDGVLEALVKKYGRPSLAAMPSATQLPLLRWVTDPSGQPVAQGMALAQRCAGTSDPDGSVNVTPDCGTVVQALLMPLKTNPGLVDRLQVGVVAQGGGWRLLRATEQGLGAADQQRRADEVAKANRNAKGPNL